MFALILLGLLIGGSLTGAYVASRAILSYVAAAEAAEVDKPSSYPTDTAIADAKVTVYQMQRRYSTLVNH